jgi:tetratricopeptide (TPR) repeat protein
MRARLGVLAIACACGAAPKEQAPPSEIVLDVGGAAAVPEAPVAGIVHHAWEFPRPMDPAGVVVPAADAEPVMTLPGAITIAPAELKRAVLAAAQELRDPSLASRADADDVLWRDAQTFAQGKYLKEARAVLQRLLKDYPTSPHVPDAYLVFGDYYLGASELADAQAFYEKAATFTGTPAAGYARVQLARVQLALGHGHDGLAMLVEIANSGADASVRSGAIAVAVDAYAQVGRAAAAPAFADQLDRDGMIAWLERLGRAYAALGKHADALMVLKAVVDVDPDVVRGCRGRVGIVRAELASGARRVDVLAELGLLARTVEGDCRGEADLLAGEVATVWTLELPKSEADPAQVVQAWAIAATLATTPRRRATAMRDRALVIWSMAESAGGRNADAWLAAADAFDKAAALDGPNAGLAQRAADARHNAQLAR